VTEHEIDRLYCLFLTAGFVVLRRAAEAGDAEWLNAELELLHNVPSMIGETRAGRHAYFWNKERTRYIEHVATCGSEAQKSSMRTYYEPIWNDMEPIILALVQT
jgi:hypothetical protein